MSRCKNHLFVEADWYSFIERNSGKWSCCFSLVVVGATISGITAERSLDELGRNDEHGSRDLSAGDVRDELGAKMRWGRDRSNV
jgi:hypothetical protein